jgi:hypothetical protein
VSRPPTSTRAQQPCNAQVGLPYIAGVFFGTRALLEIVIVLVVGAKGRKVEDRPAFAEMLIEVERVVTDTSERKEQLVDAVLNAQREPAFALLPCQLRGGLRASQRCDQKVHNSPRDPLPAVPRDSVAAAQASSRRNWGARLSAPVSVPATIG